MVIKNQLNGEEKLTLSKNNIGKYIDVTNKFYVFLQKDSTAWAYNSLGEKLGKVCRGAD